MRKSYLLISLCGVAVAALAYVQFVPQCSYRDPDVAISNPATREMVLIGYHVCRTGIRIPDLSGWSEGNCLIPGTCKGTAKQVAWQIQFDTRKIQETDIEDEKAYFCEKWPFKGERQAVYDYSFGYSPEDAINKDNNVSYPFRSCTSYTQTGSVSSGITTKQSIFTSPDFIKGLPEGWSYIGSGISPARGILFGTGFVDISNHKPEFSDAPPHSRPLPVSK